MHRNNRPALGPAWGLLMRASRLTRFRRRRPIHVKPRSEGISCLGDRARSYRDYKSLLSGAGTDDLVRQVVCFDQHHNINAIMALIECRKFNPATVSDDQLSRLGTVVDAALEDDDAVLKMVIMRRLRHRSIGGSYGLTCRTLLSDTQSEYTE